MPRSYQYLWAITFQRFFRIRWSTVRCERTNYSHWRPCFTLAAAGRGADARANHHAGGRPRSARRQYGGQIQSANLAVLQAAEDRFQAQKANLPTVNAFNQYINTQGNGTPSGIFVANDGVHVYNEQAVVHEEALMLVRHGELRRAMAAEAVAKAKVEVAARGLNATVIQNYYAILSAQHKAANTQTSSRKRSDFSISRRNRKRRGSWRAPT